MSRPQDGPDFSAEKSGPFLLTRWSDKSAPCPKARGALEEPEEPSQPSMRRIAVTGPIESMSATFTGTPSVEACTARMPSMAMATWDWLE